MAYFQLDKQGKADVSGTGASLTETVVSPSHFFIVNNTGSAVRLKVSNSAVDTSRNASGHSPAHNVHRITSMRMGHSLCKLHPTSL